MAADTIVLAVGDGLTSDYLDLNDSTNFVVSQNAGQIVIPDGLAAQRAGQRSIDITLDMMVRGTTHDGLLNNVAAIWTKLGQAQVGANPGGRTAGVTLSIRPENATEWTYFDVLHGSFQHGEQQFAGGWIRGVLVLTCRLFGRGDTESYGAFTINKANNFTCNIPAIPGHVPGLATYTITDNSSGVVLNKLMFSHKSQYDLDSGDFDGVVNAAADTGGTTTGSFTNAINSDYAGDASLAFSEGWNPIALATGGTAYADQAGFYDVWARVYDSLAVPKPPRNVITTTQGTTGSMPAGTYSIVVTASNASGESLPSNQVTLRIAAPSDEFTIDWDAPQFSTPTSYTIYFKRDTEDWKYFNQDAALGTSYNLSTESGATTADPPTAEDVLATHFRATLGLDDGVTVMTSDPVPANISNATFEALRFFSGVLVPPVPLEEGGTVEAWQVGIQAHRQDFSTQPAVRIDAVWLLPSRHVVTAEYIGMDLATARIWVIGQTRHGLAHGVLRNKSNSTAEGRVSVSNPPVLGPGDTQIVFLPLVEGGEFDVSSVSLSVSVDVETRFTYIRGV